MATALQIKVLFYDSGEDRCGLFQHLVFIKTYLLYKALMCGVAHYSNMLNTPSFFCSSVLRTTHYIQRVVLQKYNDKLILTHLSPHHLITACLTKFPEVTGCLHNFP